MRKHVLSGAGIPLRIAFAALFACLWVFAAACAGSKRSAENTLEAVTHLNSNSTLGPCCLLEAYDREAAKQKLADYKHINNFMSDDFYYPSVGDYSIMYSFSGYPDDHSSPALTEVRLQSGAYDVLGIAIGAPMEEAKALLLDLGYEYEEEDGQFILAGVELSFREADGCITRIQIRTPSEYLGERLY